MGCEGSGVCGGDRKGEGNSERGWSRVCNRDGMGRMGHKLGAVACGAKYGGCSTSLFFVTA